MRKRAIILTLFMSFAIAPLALAGCPERNDQQGAEPPKGITPPCIQQGGGLAVSGPPSDRGKPINVHSGNVFFFQGDAAVGGFGGQTLSLVRTYNSDHAFDGRRGAFGRGWAHTFEQSLWITADDPAILALRVGNGLPLYYQDADGDGVFHATLPITESSWVEVLGGGGYVRRFPSGRTETYTGGGLWIAAADPAGNVTTLTRENGQLTRVTDPGGRFIALEYTGDLISRVTGPLGEFAHYTYTSDGLLSDVSYPDGSGFVFTYDPKGQILLVKDHTNAVVERHEYQGKKGTLSEIGGGQERITLEYGTFYTRVTDARGGVTLYEYSAIWGRNHITRIVYPEGETEDWTYDDYGRLTSYKNAVGSTATYEYDPHGKLKAAMDESGVKTEYTHTSDGRIETLRTPDGVLTQWTYGPYGATAVAQSAGGRSRTTRTEYDNRGLPTRSIDAMGRAITFSYGTNGDLLSVADSAGTAIHYGYDELGRRRTITDAADRVITYAYDSRGRILQVTRSDDASSTSVYDTAGRLTSTTDVAERTTSFAYDEANRIKSITDPADGVTQFGYDVMSNRTSTTDAADKTTQFEYDLNGRLTKTTYPDGRAETIEYDYGGRPWKTTDRKAVSTMRSYDASGRLLRTSYSDGSPSVFYGYDSVGRLAMAANEVDILSWSYDAFGRMRTETSRRNSTTIAYTYDDAGAVIGKALNGAGFAGYSYDALGRLSEINHASGKYEFQYDQFSRRTAMLYPNGVTTRYAYGNLDRLAHVAASRGATPITRHAYTYDVSGGRVTKTGLDQAETYSYDDLSQLIGVARSNGSWSFKYDAVGNRLESDAMGVLQRYVYGDWNRLLRIEGGGTARIRGTVSEPSTVSIGGAAATLSGTTFEGTAAVPAGGGRVDISARDAAGNETIGSYQVPASAGGVELAYDANGALVARVDVSGAWTYEWTCRGELRRVLRGGLEVARFLYDPLGRRIEKAASGVPSSYAYDGSGVIREMTGADMSFTYVHGPGVDEPLARIGAGGQVHYYHADALGSVVKLTDSSGVTPHVYEYDVWGGIVSGASMSGYAFTGREWDAETSLYYSRARYYDPALGRFISEDPLRFAAGVNFYAYVNNNPVNLTDPFGKCPPLLGRLAPSVFRPHQTVGHRAMRPNLRASLPRSQHPPATQAQQQNYNARVQYAVETGSSATLDAVFEGAEIAKTTFPVGPLHPGIGGGPMGGSGPFISGVGGLIMGIQSDLNGFFEGVRNWFSDPMSPERLEQLSPEEYRSLADECGCLT